MTFSPQMIGNSSSVFVVIASSANAEPMAKLPTSPMKMRAGAAFHQRNPAHAPAKATASTARSSGLMMPPLMT